MYHGHSLNKYVEDLTCNVATILPLLVVELSIFHLLWTSVRLLISSKTSSRYETLASDTGPESRAQTGLPPHALDADISDDVGEEAVSVEGSSNGRLMLVKATSRGSIVEAETPLGRRTSEVIEGTAIVALIATHAVVLRVETDDDDDRTVTPTEILTWVYTLVLCSLRLFMTQSRGTARIGNPTAASYTANWFLSLVIVRSQITHPVSSFAKEMAILQFISETSLFGIALTTRKGNQTLLMEWEDRIQPSPERLASLFSTIRFSWVDDIIWQGWKQSLSIGDVWNLMPKDKFHTL